MKKLHFIKEKGHALLETYCHRQPLVIKAGFSIVELIIAVSLLGAIILTAVSLELSMRRQQLSQSIQAKLFNELIPVVELIKKDFRRSFGFIDNSSVMFSPNSFVSIRIDSNGNEYIDPGDIWHNYTYNQTGTLNQVRYYSNASLPSYKIVAQGITGFSVNVGYDNTSLSIYLATRKSPYLPKDQRTNPEVDLNTTLFSRMTSAL